MGLTDEIRAAAALVCGAARSIRAQAAWKVISHIARVRAPTSSSTRSRISCAALFVNVIARISPGCAWSV